MCNRVDDGDKKETGRGNQHLLRGPRQPIFYILSKGRVGENREDTLVTTPSKQSTKGAPKLLKVHYKTENIMTKKPNGSSW